MRLIVWKEMVRANSHKVVEVTSKAKMMLLLLLLLLFLFSLSILESLRIAISHNVRFAEPASCCRQDAPSVD